MNDILILSTNDGSGARVTRVLGEADDCSVRPRSPVGNLLGGLRAAFGGEQQGCAWMVTDTCEKAVASLAQVTSRRQRRTDDGLRFRRVRERPGTSHERGRAYGPAVILER